MVRARLRRDAFLIPTDDGARIIANNGAESFTGASIHGWIDRLTPYLTGKSTVDDLVSALPADKGAMVERIITALLDRGLVRDGGNPDPASGELGYLDSFLPAADLAYRDYRSATVAVLGTGPVAREIVGALGGSGVGRVGDSLAGADLVVHVSDPATHDQALEVDRACRDSGIPVVHGAHLAGEFWICLSDWESAWRRLRRWQQPRPDPGELAADALAVVAGMLGQAAFRRLTGTVQPAELHTMTCLHLPSLRTTTHRFLPCGAGTTDKSFVDMMVGLEAGERLDRAELDSAGTALLDPRLGVLGEVSERDFPQLPLNLAAATVAGWSRPVIGAGLSVKDARWRAILHGLAGYAVSTPDPARFVGGHVWARSLATGTAWLVPATDVFTIPDEGPAGVAAGDTWAEAVSAGLLDACARLTASQPGPPRRLDPHALGPDVEALAYLRMIDILGLPLAVYDITGPLRAPTLAFHLGERTIDVVSAPRAADALPDGLRAVVLDAQLGQPTPAPRLDLAGAPDGEPAPPCTERELIDALLAGGRDPLVVPLDHDPEVHRIMPYLVRVVMAYA